MEEPGDRMHIFRDADYKNLSFEFSNVLEKQFNPDDRIIKLHLDKAVWELKPKKTLKRGFIIFSNWESITYHYYEPGEGDFPIQNLPEDFLSRDLPYFAYSDDNVWLEGDTTEGWVGCIMVKPNFYAEFEDSELGWWTHEDAFT